VRNVAIPEEDDDERIDDVEPEGLSAMEKVIRELAYELWEQAGRPYGRSDEFWFAARYEFEHREETGETQLCGTVRLRPFPRPSWSSRFGASMRFARTACH